MSKSEMYEGFNVLSEYLGEYIKKAENPIKTLVKGAEALVKDLLKLSKPMSKIRISTYTHLVRTFSYRVKNKEVEVGWGKYYGPMLENGTVKMNPREHLKPTFNRNQDKYFKIMIDDIRK